MNGKILLIGLVIAAIVLSGCVQENPPISETTEPLIYEGQDIRIVYPADWVRGEREDESGTYVRITKGEFTDPYTPAVNIQIISPLNIVSWEEFVEAILIHTEQDRGEGQIISHNETVLGGIKAYKVNYTRKVEGELDLKTIRIWLRKNDLTYDIIYVAKIEEYETYLETAQEIINSFEIT